MTDPAFQPLPDAEYLCTYFLRNHVTFSELVNGKISTELPNPRDFPCVTLSRTGGVSVARMRVDDAQIQVSGWGNDKREAFVVASAARAALHDMQNFHLEGEGVVTGVVDLSGPFWFPDDSVTPPIPRYVFDVRVITHP
jgi:hypothetical protein